MSTDVGRIIDEIRRLPHWRTFSCPSCGSRFDVHALQIHAACGRCGHPVKCRAYGAVGTELPDVIDAVLEWAGEGESLRAVMRRHRAIVAHKENEGE